MLYRLAARLSKIHRPVSVRKNILQGRAPKVEVAILIDEKIRSLLGLYAILRRSDPRNGLPYGMWWWLAGGLGPRIAFDDPPVSR